jgi:hypothetical protein
MKKVTFYGYSENCNCTFCKTLREIMDRDKAAHINSFILEDSDRMTVPNKPTTKEEK